MTRVHRLVAACALFFAASGTAIRAPDRRPLANWRAFGAHTPEVSTKNEVGAPRRVTLLQLAYSAVGLATTAAWSTIVVTTIRSNQPVGMLMPSWQHGFFARVGALSAVPVIASCFSTLADASADSWERLASPTCRRLNLALAAGGLGSAVWVGLAPVLTRIPNTTPLVSHQAYHGAMRSGLIGAFGSAALLSAAVWSRSIPREVRSKPLSWPLCVADGISKSLVSLAPANVDDPVNVKYALLATGFAGFTAVPLLAVPSFPLSVIPSWTGRRLSRIFPAWTLLAAASSLSLKEATEAGRLAASRTLANGLRGFGVLYLAAKLGAVFLDPSFPEAYHAVKLVPGPAAAAIVVIGLTLRPDHRKLAGVANSSE